jgi:hypothetical protein
MEKCSTIATIDSTEIANEGGIMNCISWNILSFQPVTRTSPASLFLLQDILTDQIVDVPDRGIKLSLHFLRRLEG